MNGEQKWITILNRRSTILFHNLVVKGQAKQYYREMYGIDFEIRNFKYVDGQVTIGLGDLQDLGRLLAKRLEQDHECLDEFMREGYKQGERLIDISKTIAALEDLERITREELLDWYKRYVEEVLRMMPSLIATPTIERMLEERISNGLSVALEKLGRKDFPDRYIGLLVFARKQNFVVQELRELLDIGAQIQKDDEVSKLFSAKVPEDIEVALTDKSSSLLSKISDHAERFGFLNMYCYEGNPMSVEDVISRLKELTKDGCASKLEDAKKASKEAETKYAGLLNELSISEDLLGHIEHAQEYLYYRLYRLDELMIAGYYVRDFIEEIARRMGIDYDEMMHLWHEEVERFLETGELPDLAKIQERREHFATLLENGNFEILSGDELTQFISKEKTREPTIEEHVQELQGVTASIGKHKGPVKIVLCREDIDKVEIGDVLVSTMTNPYYVPAMIRAKAIVCDEGGILSHAAIVSRELGIPCIIGTRFATKVLADDDLVEVDAAEDRGIVRVLKERSDT